MSLTILYQDKDLVAVHKPAGLLVHRSLIDKHETRFAMQMLRDQIGQHVYPVHRLDRPTSGVLLFALSSQVATLLGEKFAAQQVSKTYFAIVRGYTQSEGVITHPLKEKLDKIADKLANQNKPAQEACSYYQTQASFELPYAVGRYRSARYSLVKLCPKTGRKHQLRRHMAHISHPILGDTTHGDGKHNKFVREQFGFDGMGLTCQAMQLQHPINNTPLLISSDFDQRLLKLLVAWGWDPSGLQQFRINTN